MAGTPEEAAQGLVELANARGGSDNISIIIVRLSDLHAAPVKGPSKPSSRRIAPAWDEMPTAPRPVLLPSRVLRRGQRLSRKGLVMVAMGGGVLVLLVLSLAFAGSGTLRGKPSATPTISLATISVPTRNEPTPLNATPQVTEALTYTQVVPIQTQIPLTQTTSLNCIYIVLPNEFAGTIAQKFSVDLTEIKNGDPARVNENGPVGEILQQRDYIIAGQKLIIPNLPGEGCPPGTNPTLLTPRP
jgi:hypothetical protein